MATDSTKVRVAVAGDHLGARHFGGVLGMQLDARAVVARRDGCGERAQCEDKYNADHLQNKSTFEEKCNRGSSAELFFVKRQKRCLLYRGKGGVGSG